MSSSLLRFRGAARPPLAGGSAGALHRGARFARSTVRAAETGDAQHSSNKAIRNQQVNAPSSECGMHVSAGRWFSGPTRSQKRSAPRSRSPSSSRPPAHQRAGPNMQPCSKSAAQEVQEVVKRRGNERPGGGVVRLRMRACVRTCVLMSRVRVRVMRLRVWA